MPSRSSDREPRSLPERIAVGRVRRAHGLRGEVAVEVDSDVDGRFDIGSELWLVAGSHKPGPTRRVRITGQRPAKGCYLIRFDGIDDRDAAEAMRGSGLEIDRSEVPPADEGSWYFFELVGCHCSDVEAGDLGTVTNVVEDGGGFLLEIDDKARGTLLIPFVNDFLETVQIDSGRIEVRLPPGLIETCTSPH